MAASRERETAAETPRHVHTRYHDPGKLDPERVYHAFVVGLLAVLEPAYQVRSNRESGRGRPDVVIRPSQPGKPGAVLELIEGARSPLAEADPAPP